MAKKRIGCVFHGIIDGFFCGECLNDLKEIEEFLSPEPNEIVKAFREKFEKGEKPTRFVSLIVNWGKCSMIKCNETWQTSLRLVIVSYYDFLIRGSINIKKKERDTLIKKLEEVAAELNLESEICMGCGEATDEMECPVCKKYFLKSCFSGLDFKKLLRVAKRALSASISLELSHLMYHFVSFLASHSTPQHE